MTALVRIFTHDGIVSAKVDAGGGGGRYSSDSLFMLKQPYLGRQLLSVGSGVAVSSSAATAPKGASLLHVEVEPGKTVHYEINPPNRITSADTSSPTLTGKTQFNFGIGWTISVLESV
jgi:hypothetical protein